MKKSAKHILRIALLALIFQIGSPLFVSVITINNEFQPRDTKTALHASDHSVTAPTLLKEKDETETKEHYYVVELFQLIDFTDHASVLAESHNTKIIPLHYLCRFDLSPPLFTLNSVFLI